MGPLGVRSPKGKHAPRTGPANAGIPALCRSETVLECRTRVSLARLNSARTRQSHAWEMGWQFKPRPNGLHQCHTA